MSRILTILCATLLSSPSFAESLSCKAHLAFSESEEVINFEISDGEIRFTNSFVWGQFTHFTTFYMLDLGREGLSISESTEEKSGRRYSALLELKLNYRSKKGTMNVGDEVAADGISRRMGKFQEYTVMCL